MIDKPKIEKAIREILEAIGEDVSREGLIDTPKRVANMYEEIFSGLNADPKKLVKLFYAENVDEMVLVKDIHFHSICEHHLLPFTGHVHIAYIPQNCKVIGLSKIARIVDILSKKPQLQERFTAQIANTIMESVEALGVMVLTEAEHLCMTMRGIKKPGSKTITTSTCGILKSDIHLRNEALTLITKGI